MISQIQSKFSFPNACKYFSLLGLVRVVDKYAEYFLEELDFTKESIRTDDSTLQIRTTPLRTSSSIVVPMTYKEHSSEKVLISEWMDFSE